MNVHLVKWGQLGFAYKLAVLAARGRGMRAAGGSRGPSRAGLGAGSGAPRSAGGARAGQRRVRAAGGAAGRALRRREQRGSRPGEGGRDGGMGGWMDAWMDAWVDGARWARCPLGGRQPAAHRRFPDHSQVRRAQRGSAGGAPALGPDPEPALTCDPITYCITSKLLRRKSLT